MHSRYMSHGNRRKHFSIRVAVADIISPDTCFCIDADSCICLRLDGHRVSNKDTSSAFARLEPRLVRSRGDPGSRFAVRGSRFADPDLHCIPIRQTAAFLSPFQTVTFCRLSLQISPVRGPRSTPALASLRKLKPRYTHRPIPFFTSPFFLFASPSRQGYSDRPRHTWIVGSRTRARR